MLYDYRTRCDMYAKEVRALRRKLKKARTKRWSWKRKWRLVLRDRRVGEAALKRDISLLFRRLEDNRSRHQARQLESVARIRQLEAELARRDTAATALLADAGCAQTVTKLRALVSRAEGKVLPGVSAWLPGFKMLLAYLEERGL